MSPIAVNIAPGAMISSDIIPPLIRQTGFWGNSKLPRRSPGCGPRQSCLRRFRCSLRTQPRRPLLGRRRFLLQGGLSQPELLLLRLPPPASLSGPRRFPALVIAARLRKVPGFVHGIVCRLSRVHCCRSSRPREQRGRVLPRARERTCRCGSANCVLFRVPTSP